LENNLLLLLAADRSPCWVTDLLLVFLVGVFNGVLTGVFKGV
jgi:hypothetical protein